MKHLYIKLFLILFVLSGLLNNVLAQAPEGIIYQAEASDNKGHTIKNATLDVKITIHEDNAKGAIVWQGLHNVTTNNYGMFVLVIGEGTSSYVFEAIDWANHAHFLNVKVKTTKGKKASTWVDMGTTQLLSVPYALHSKTASTVLAAETDPVYSLDPAASITDAGSGLVISNTQRTKLAGIEDNAEVNVNADWNATGGDSQILNKPTNVSEFTNDEGFLSAETDGSVTNELNTKLALNGTTLEVTDAGGKKTADLSSLVTGGDLTSCDILLNFLILTGDDVANLINAGAPIMDLFNAGHGVGALEQNGVDEQVLIDEGLIGTFTDVRDDHEYKWVKIGTQVWMAENLAYNATGSWSYADDINNVAIYGRLYDWPTTMDGAASSLANPSGVQGVCPTGWHVPSDAEWTKLSTFLGGEEIAGGRMKETGTLHWDSPNEGATNASGFSGLPGGYRDGYGGGFDTIGERGYWWSATESELSTSSAWHRSLRYSYPRVYRAYTNKGYGFSVRCVRD